MTDTISPLVIGGLGIVIGIGCIATFITISRFVGSSDKWIEIQDQTASIWTMSLFGSLSLFLAGFFYFRMNNNHEKIMYFIFAVTFLAMALASSALGVALIHKK